MTRQRYNGNVTAGQRLPRTDDERARMQEQTTNWRERGSKPTKQTTTQEPMIHTSPTNFMTSNWSQNLTAGAASAGQLAALRRRPARTGAGAGSRCPPGEGPREKG